MSSLNRNPNHCIDCGIPISRGVARRCRRHAYQGVLVRSLVLTERTVAVIERDAVPFADAVLRTVVEPGRIIWEYA